MPWKGMPSVKKCQAEQLAVTNQVSGNFHRQLATLDNPALSNVWTTVDRSFSFIEIKFTTNLLSSWSVSSMIADLSGKVAVIREEVRQN